MTRRVAYFVEGVTELIFVERLLREFSGPRNVSISSVAWRGHRLVELRGSDPEEDDSHFFLIVDCGSDESVKSAVRERLPSLEAAGYDLVIGLWDLHPLASNRIQEAEGALYVGMQASTVEVRLFLAVREIETWFIQEHTHFPRIHESLTPPVVRGELGVDPRTHPVDVIEHAAEALNSVYQLAGVEYSKKRWQVQRTVDKLDFDVLYVESTELLPHLKAFLSAVSTSLN